ncbi:MAG: hypothetical protein L7S63_03370 [Flavobacteriales bacterium]|nr:hypothetical protein [Flavobacteriales bacterium]
MSSPQDTDFLIQALPLLLHDHDCLVIPELGGFVAHPVPARFDEDKGEWVPPGRNVVFNPKLTVRDGLLEQEIRRATGCSTDAATALIDRESNALKEHLDAGGTREVPGLGRMYRMESGQFGFAPEPRLGERYAPPGLGRIPWADRLAAAAEQKPDHLAPPVPVADSEQEAAPEGVTPWTRTLVRIAAVLMLPLVVAGSLWWGQTEGTQFDLAIFDRATPSEYLPRIEGEDIRFPEIGSESSLVFLNPGAPDITPAPADEAMMPLPTPSPLSSGCRLHVIAGTFSAMNRAAGLARRFESLGYATSILAGPSGSHRVSTGCFDSSSEAEAFRRGLQSHHGIDQAWILQL